MTVGPYRPIRFLTYTARLADVHAHATVSQTLIPSLTVSVSLQGDLDEIESIQVCLRASNGDKTQDSEAGRADQSSLETLIIQDEFRPDAIHPEHKNIIHWDFEKNEVKLWWPVGYGSQALYDLEVNLFGDVCC